MKEILIKKNNGESVIFDPEKLTQSLISSGASKADAENIGSLLIPQVKDGMTTHSIYKLAYSLLSKKSGRVAGRYRLKKAIFDMGPTGYPFERLVSELIRLKGFTTQSGIVLEGKCVKHEVDVYARNSKKTIFAECKFHNEVHRYSDLKVSMYVKSRFEDLKANYQAREDESHIFEGWLITNTRFTSDALNYGNCAGLSLISWDYPSEGNLKQLIDASGFHPITSLKSLTKQEKDYLLNKEIILCRNLLTSIDSLEKLGIKQKRIDKIIKEANSIISL